MLLKLLGSQVRHHQSDDIADNRSEIAPCQRLAHHEIGYSTDKREVPVVPQIDINSTRTFSYKQQEIHAQQDRNDERAHSRIVRHSSGSRPSHVKHLQRPVIQVRNTLQRRREIVSQQFSHHIQSNKAHTNEKTAFQGLAKLHANTQSDNGKQDRHHYGSTKTDNISKYLFHKLVSY